MVSTGAVALLTAYGPVNRFEAGSFEHALGIRNMAKQTAPDCVVR
jgi:hypothetical protein